MLDRQLGFLRRHYEVLRPTDFERRLRGAAGRHVMITFDDGYRDLYELAHPVLQAHGVCAAMFLCSGLMDGVASAWWDEIGWMLRHSRLRELPPGPWSTSSLPLAADTVEETIEHVTRAYWELAPPAAAAFLEQLASASAAGRRPSSGEDWLTWDMARELKAAGHLIGAHTRTHPVLSRLPRDQQSQEIRSSLDRIEESLGERPSWFAYPVGTRQAFDRTTMEAARESGVELAFSNYGGRVHTDAFAELDVRRVSAESRRQISMLSATLTVPQVFA
jgi:peptidoglycan/xylan/chitin deacetylase (PgdA/CDA1 family)